MHRGAAEAAFPHRHLLGIEGLSPDDINHVLDLADGYVELNRQAEKKRNTLRGRTIINCFFECSTRARTSFELAGKRVRQQLDLLVAGLDNQQRRRRSRQWRRPESVGYPMPGHHAEPERLYLKSLTADRNERLLSVRRRQQGWAHPSVLQLLYRAGPAGGV